MQVSSTYYRPQYLLCLMLQLRIIVAEKRITFSITLIYLYFASTSQSYHGTVATD